MSLVTVACSAHADEKAEQVVRDVTRIQKLTKVAILPVVIQVRFDNTNGVPDPARLAARSVAVERLAAIIEEKFKSSPFKVLPAEAGSLAVKENGWQAADLYSTVKSGSWDVPIETFKNKKGDTVNLLGKKDDLKKDKEVMTLFRFHWHDLPETVVGLASFDMGALAEIDRQRAKELGAKLGVDGLLYCQVTEVETHEGTTGLGVLTGEKFKSTRVHLHFTLISPDDGTIIWQAKARGVKSQKTGVFTGARAYNGEDRKVIEGTVAATEILLSDLAEGTGVPVKQKK